VPEIGAIALPPKRIATVVRIQQEAGNAALSKVAQTLGPHGVNIGLVVKEFNTSSAPYQGLQCAADVVVYEDQSFEVRVNGPTTVALLKQAVGVDKGTLNPGSTVIASIDHDRLRRVAEQKMSDMNAHSIEAAVRIVAGTARSMGIRVVE
jgi:large subunit ribosomal protein L11